MNRLVMESQVTDDFFLRFNLVRFSRTCERWQQALVEPTDDNCREAVQWVAQLAASGNTCTLEALQVRVAGFCGRSHEQESRKIIILT